MPSQPTADYYPGYTELVAHVSNQNSASASSLDTFLKNNMENIAGWTGIVPDADVVKTKWCKRFKRVLKEISPNLQPDTNCAPETWNTIYKLAEAGVALQLAGIQAMKDTAGSTGKRVAKTTNLMNQQRTELDSSSSSWSSIDDRPTIVYLNAYDLTNENFVTVQENEMWIDKSHNISKSLFNFRKQSINEAKKHTKSLSPRRELSLSHVYLFAFDEDQSAYPFRSNSLSVKRNVSYEKLTEEADDWCRAIVWALMDAAQNEEDDDSWKIRSMVIGYMLKATEMRSKPLLYISETLYHLATTPQQWNLNPTEDTHVHAHVTPVINAIFTKDSQFIYNWANTSLEATRNISTSSVGNSVDGSEVERLLPDFMASVKVQGRVFDLLAVEVKPPKKGGHDLQKLGRELKIMIDALVTAKVANPIVCGIVVEGSSVRTYMLQLRYNGIYEMIQLQDVDLITKYSQLSQLPLIIAAFTQVKTIISLTAKEVKYRILNKLDGQNNSTKNVIPVSWTRPDLKRRERVKKRKAQENKKGKSVAAKKRRS
ncbi:hypothetical protein BDA99DRAFT_500379 [Phascolomyces articulosus]|uniref:Uncharacterized protein n=1 Tax=Phascolomyces articulosus TaxID=60185 RepID=A0AAD5K691_9FUNG|nr:hypothetical protein BDA99DRAFT_500379 [Phascolomyces articulosus]